MRSALPWTVAACAVAAAAPARAGPAHVLASQAVSPPPADAAYAVAPALDEATRRALAEGLRQAGLRVAPADAPHAYLVTVEAGVGALCTRSCSQLVLHDDSRLDDYYRHKAVVTAQANTGEQFAAARPVAWYTVLQSDGLSARRGDYLPGLLRYGARAYGRNTTPESPPQLEPPVSILPPNVTSSPGG